MPVGPHIIRAQASLPITEGVRAELVNFGERNLRAENVRPIDDGEARTRFGFAALGNLHSDGTSPAAGYRMFSDGTTPVRICDGQVEAYSQAESAWKQLGRVSEAACRLIGAPSVGNTSTLEDVESCNGYFALSWLAAPSGTSADAYIAIVDQATGSIVRPPEKVGTSTSVSPAHLATYGVYFVTARFDSTGTKIVAHYLDTTSNTTIANGWIAFGASLCTDALGTTGYSAMAIHSLSSLSRVALVYANNLGGVSQGSVKTFDITGVLQSTTVNTGGVLPTAVAIGGNPSDTLWVAWNQAAGAVVVTGLNPGSITSVLASGGAMFSVATGVANNGIGIAGTSTVTGKARVWAVSTSATPQSTMGGVKTTAGAAANDGTPQVVPAAAMVRKPFHYNGRYYSAFTGGDAANVQLNHIVCDWTDDVTFIRPVANPSPGLAPGSQMNRCKFVNISGGAKFYGGLSVRRSGVADSSALCELDFNATSRWQPAAWGNSVYLSGGVASCYDGARVAECGFLIRPPLPTGAASGAGAINATWRYICVYEEVDADGNWHQSGISSPSAVVTMTNNVTSTVTTSPLSITARMSATAGARSVRVAFYRTLTGGASPYYRLGFTINDTSATTVTFADTTTDAVLATAAKLYEQPGVPGTSQDKRPPPPFQCIVSYNGMIVGASGADVWYSGQNVSGEGAWFNPIFSVPVPGDGDITAMWAMDGTLFVAKRGEIYSMTGDPPSDNGAGGGLGTPRRLSVDVGCIEPRSTCVTSLGTFFQSVRGIELLTRAQAVAWIGKHVFETVSTYPICTSITLDPANSGWVIVELAQSQSSGAVAGNGRSLVFDLDGNAWVSADRRTSAAGLADCPSQSACIISTVSGYRYAWMTSAGVVHYENRNTHLDPGGVWVTPLIETGWFNGFQNEQRVYRASLLFQVYSAAGLKVEVAYDYGDYNSLDNAVWSVADTSGQRQLEMAIAPRGETMKFRITGTPPNPVLSTAAGIGVFAIVLDLAAKQGPTKGTTRLDPALRR